MWVDYTINSLPGRGFRVEGDWPGEVMGLSKDGKSKDRKENPLYSPGDVFIVNVVMDHESNPLSSIPDFSTRHMIMQVLAWMWCIVFAIIVGSMWAGIFSMVLHALLLAAIAITVATFETAKRNPKMFVRDNVINSRGVGGEHE